jgi:DNA-binding MarR family transcriptional regulator
MVAASAVLERRSSESTVLELVDLVHEVLHSTLVQLHPTLGEEGITMGQFWALHTVSSLEAASVSTVARYLGVSPPTVCVSIDQLEASGLVRRERSEKDRRSVELSLTARGRKVEARVWGQIARRMSDGAREVPSADLKAAVRVFRELARGLDPTTAPSPREVA